MKKIFIGFVAVAAMGVAILAGSRSKAPAFLSANVDALAMGEELDYLCAYCPGDYCEYEFDDGDIPCPDCRRDDEPPYNPNFY